MLAASKERLRALVEGQERALAAARAAPEAREAAARREQTARTVRLLASAKAEAAARCETLEFSQHCAHTAQRGEHAAAGGGLGGAAEAG